MRIVISSCGFGATGALKNRESSIVAVDLVVPLCTNRDDSETQEGPTRVEPYHTEHEVLR